MDNHTLKLEVSAPTVSVYKTRPSKQTIVNNMIGALAAEPLRMIGWSDTGVEVFAAKVLSNLQNSDMHKYIDYF